MSPDQHEGNFDPWSRWLLHHRHAGDVQFLQSLRKDIQRYTDRVIDGALLGPGMCMLDVGTGDGAVAFRAIERLGPSLNVVLTDVSAAMLRHCATLAGQLGIQSQCTFLQGDAEHIPVGDASVDAVTTRAVLAYVPSKVSALKECFRILKPGGRLSIAEPILRDDALSTLALKIFLENSPADQIHRFMPLLYRWRSAQFPDTDEGIRQSPIANYSERDLVRFAQEAGFARLHMEFHIDVEPAGILSWDTFIGSSPHPLAPSLRTVLVDFTEEERRDFEAILRPVVENADSLTTNRIAYLTATRPAN